MKTKVTLFLLFLSFCFGQLHAQETSGKRHFDVERFKKDRADFLIKEVGMTDEESKTLIPLSNELMEKKFQMNKPIRKQMRTLRDNPNATDAEYTKVVDDLLNEREKEAQLDKDYYQKFKKILSPQKLYKYQKAEARFMQRMVKGHTGRAKPDDDSKRP